MPKFFQAAWRAPADRNEFQYGGMNKKLLGSSEDPGFACLTCSVTDKQAIKTPRQKASPQAGGSWFSEKISPDEAPSPARPPHGALGTCPSAFSCKVASLLILTGMPQTYSSEKRRYKKRAPTRWKLLCRKITQAELVPCTEWKGLEICPGARHSWFGCCWNICGLLNNVLLGSSRPRVSLPPDYGRVFPQKGRPRARGAGDANTALVFCDVILKMVE